MLSSLLIPKKTQQTVGRRAPPGDVKGRQQKVVVGRWQWQQQRRRKTQPDHRERRARVPPRRHGGASAERSFVFVELDHRVRRKHEFLTTEKKIKGAKKRDIFFSFFFLFFLRSLHPLSLNSPSTLSPSHTHRSSLPSTPSKAPTPTGTSSRPSGTTRSGTASASTRPSTR